MKALEAFRERGWVRFGADPAITEWVEAVREHALSLAEDPLLRAQWLRCGGTWFAGVNALANGADGSLPEHQVPPLRGTAIKFVRTALDFGAFDWDRAQISICYPGYPRWQEGEESEAAFRYRRDRHAAHVDGIGRTGAERRRYLTECHGFILGIPLTPAAAGAAPLSVWEGSHEVFRTALRAMFAGHPPDQWGAIEVTQRYTETRRQCFESCARVGMAAAPGEVYIVHRLALHGIAPWCAPDDSPPRAVAYFRPDPFPGHAPDWWLALP